MVTANYALPWAVVLLMSLSDFGEAEQAAFHTGEFLCAALSHDGTTAATGTGEKGPYELVLWDVKTSRELRVFPQAAPVRQVLFAPDDSVIAAACFDKTVKLIDPRAGRVVAVLRGHESMVNGVCFSSDGTKLASIELSGIVTVWDVEAREQHKSWKVGSYRPYTVGLSPDGAQLLSAGRGNVIEVWDVKEAKLLRTLQGHEDAVETAIFSPDASLIASSSWDRTVRIWKADTGELRFTIDGHGAKVQRVAFSPDGKTLLSGSADRTARLWSVEDGRPIATVKAHQQRVYDVGFSADGKKFITASWEKSAKVWDVETVQDVAVLRRTPVPAVSSVATLKAHEGGATFVTIAPDGKTLVTGGEDRLVRLWDMSSGELLETLKRHGHKLSSGAVSPDGSTLATGDDAGVIPLWDIAKGKHLAELRKHKLAINRLMFFPDGKRLASAGDDGIAKVWDLESRSIVMETEPTGSALTGLAISPNGTVFATCSDAGEASETPGAMLLWDTESGKPVGQYPNLTGAGYRGIQLSPDGDSLAATASDGYLRIWSIADGRMRASIRQDARSLGFSLRGFRLVVIDNAGRVAMLDSRTLERMAIGDNQTGGIKEICVLPDQPWFITTSQAGQVHLWASGNDKQRYVAVRQAWSNVDLLSTQPKGN